MPTTTAQPHKTQPPCNTTMHAAWLCLLLLLAVGFPAQLSGQPTDPPPAKPEAAEPVPADSATADPQPEAPPPTPTPLEILTSPDTLPELRTAAAEAILALPEGDPALANAAALLTNASPQPARALLEALSHALQPQALWFSPIADLARGNSPLATDAVLALGSFRTR